uniref:Neurotransmitter-gated ion-channel ligand-binding domain-containing protein n=1 Tax=Fundulus heteroclitus TaxID=8078 RepID=A0A3Q2NSZ1_FUNHE
TLWDPEEFFLGTPDVPYTYLHYDGIVYDAKPVRVVSSCSLNIYLFPFDIQNCTFTFNSYIHSSKEAFQHSIPWLKFHIQSNCLLTCNPLLQISVRRHSTMYVVNLLIPSCFLITVDLFSFMLPVQNVDRSLFKMTLVLGYTVFLLSTNDLLPITGDTIPLINVFLSLCLTMMVTSLLETILITNLLMGSAHYTPPPRWIKVFVCHFLGRLVCLPPKPEHQEDLVIKNPDNVPKGNEMAERKKTLKEEETLQVLKNLGRDLQAIHQHVVQQLKRSLGSKEWIQVGLVIDRLLFIFYIIFLSVSFISIIIIWVNSYNSV